MFYNKRTFFVVFSLQYISTCYKVIIRLWIEGVFGVGVLTATFNLIIKID
jgi:hypothetical protein